MLVVDRAGAITLVNTQAERLFGYPSEELVGAPISMLVPRALRADHEGHVHAYVRDPRPREMGAGLPLSGLRRDGSEFSAEISLNAIEIDDGPTIVVAVRDVSERIAVQEEASRLRAEAERARLERQLQRSQRLESIGQLAGGVAHDFNNLLGVILNYASFVGDELERADAEAGETRWESVRSDIEQVTLAAQRAARLTRQLLAFAWREVMWHEAVDLNSVVHGLEELLQRTIGEHVELLFRIGTDVPVTTADPGQLEQVLLNLAVNARDTMPAGGTLIIETAGVDVDEADASSTLDVEAGRYARIRVSDTGTGMTAEVAKQAFEPFFTTKPEDVGTGLGLATVYGNISQLGGQTSISSEPGVGTTISVLLPAAESAAPEPATPESATPAPSRAGRDGNETIVVAEDDAATREVISRILTRHGYQVLAAPTGAGALELIRDHAGPVHLLLADVVMPKMLGREVAERARALRPEIRVVFMSAYAHALLDATESLSDDFALLEKPFREPALLEAVREALEHDDDLRLP